MNVAITCIDCGKRFYDRELYQGHVHPMSTPYRCVGCGVSFADPVSFRMHYCDAERQQLQGLLGGVIAGGFGGLVIGYIVGTLVSGEPELTLAALGAMAVVVILVSIGLRDR